MPEWCLSEWSHKDFWTWVKIGGPEIEGSYWLRAKNQGLSLVERTGFKNSRHWPSVQKYLSFHSFHTVISTIRLQSPQSDCNLSNQTAIPTIRLQYSQSMNRFYHVVHIGVHIPECVKHPAHCLRLQSQQSDCNLSNLTAISVIRLRSQQSDCNSSGLQLDCTDWFELQNRTAIRLQSPQSDCNLHNQSADMMQPPWVPLERTTVYVSYGTFFRVQSQQSDYNLSNLAAILLDCS